MLSNRRANQWRPLADIDDEAGRWEAVVKDMVDHLAKRFGEKDKPF